MSTVLPETIRAVAAGVRARGAGILDAPVSGSVTTTRVGRADDHGRRRDGRPRARPAGPRAAGASTIFHLGGARHRRRDEARRQHRSSSGSTAPSRRAWSSPSAAASSAASPTTSSPRAPPARRSSATSATRSSSRRRRPVAFSLRARREGPAPHRRARPARPGLAMPQAAHEPRTRSGPRSGRWARTPTSRRSRVTCVRRAGDDRSAMRRRRPRAASDAATTRSDHIERGNDR